MDIEIPKFEGSTQERIDAIESFLITLAERLKSSDFSIVSVRRVRQGEGEDEIAVTYDNGNKARYLVTRIK